MRSLNNFSSTYYAIAKTIYPNSEYPEDILYNLNWVVMGSTAGNSKRIKSEPSQSQINALYELGQRKIRDSNGVLYEF